MYLTRFEATSFRNIERCSVEFSPGVQLLSGRNAQGKTNVVEGIYLFARGKSFRSATDRDMVKFGHDGFRLYVEYENKDGKQSLEYVYHNGQRKRKKNGYEIKRITDMIGNFRAVLFTPDHLRLVKESPEERRSFLNVAISQCYPVYVNLYADYKKALEERNCLLKLAGKGLIRDMDELYAWSLSLSKYSAEIYRFRKDYIKKLSEYAAPMQAQLSEGEEKLDILYKTDISEETDSIGELTEQYTQLYSRNLSREIAAGVTLYGPCREDMEMTLNGQSVRHFASQGQQRSVVLSLKHAEGEVSRDVSGEYPIYIMDDVMSELDEKRRSFLLKNTEDRQRIVTGCDLSAQAFGQASYIYVEKGQYVSSYR